MTYMLCKSLLWILLSGTVSYGAESSREELAKLPLDEPTVEYPKHKHVVVVTEAPYNAKGDGQTDDTQAIQRAINDHTGHHRIIFFPPGVYLVSATLKWPKKYADHDNWGFTTLQGASASQSIIRLKDSTFIDESNPASIMWCGGFGSADWFHNYIEGLTFNVGRQNPGAIGLQFYTNNYGAIRNCRIVSEDRQGIVGLDLAHRDMNGPLLVRNVAVHGFRTGVLAGNAVNSQTFEYLSLNGQTEIGFENQGQAISIRKMRSHNSVVALRTYGLVCLLASELIGESGADQLPAVVNYNGGKILVQDLKTENYRRAVAETASPDMFAAYRLTNQELPLAVGPSIDEYFTGQATAPLSPSTKSLRLPVEETPDSFREPASNWAVVDQYGADPTGNKDSTSAIQQAMNSGKATVFFPGHYAIRETINVPGHVRRIIGIGGHIDYAEQASPDLRVMPGSGKTLTIEHFSSFNGGIENQSDRDLVFRSLGGRIRSSGKGKLFLEDIAGDELKMEGQTAFARQLNIENEGTHLHNSGGSVWVLGYKTERGGTLVETTDHGRTEIFGTFSYTTTAGDLAPMIVNDRSSAFVWLGEVCYSGNPFSTLLRERQGDETVLLKREQGHTTPYVGVERRPKTSRLTPSRR